MDLLGNPTCYLVAHHSTGTGGEVIAPKASSGGETVFVPTACGNYLCEAGGGKINLYVGFRVFDFVFFWWSLAFFGVC